MKSFLYSTALKTFAVIVFIICFSLMLCLICDFYTDVIDSNHPFIYRFEESYTDMKYLISALMSPHNVVYDTYYNIYFNYEKETIDFSSALDRNLNNMYWRDKIYYHISINGDVYTNYTENPENLINFEFYSYIQRQSNGNSFIDISHNNLGSHWNLYYGDTNYYGADGSDIKIYTAVIPSFANECRVLWELQRRNLMDLLIYSALMLLAAITSFVYLVSVCGKNGHGENVSLWIDNAWTEAHLVFVLASVLGAVALILALLDAYPYGYFTKDIISLATVSITTIFCAIFLLSSLSLVRKIKFKTFAKESVVLALCMLCWRVLCKIIRYSYRTICNFFNSKFTKLKKSVHTLYKTLTIKSAVILLGLFLTYTVSVCLMSIGIVFSSFWLLTTIVIFCIGCFYIAYRVKDLSLIKHGIKKIQNGNLAHKIEGVKSGDLQVLAESVNGIAKGLDESLSAKLKAERLKTELITNVSHDIKTPLTSIINYTVLLSQVEGLPEEAKDYIKIISDKSTRLKNLTIDLFDISKAQSGNENVELVRLDLSVLVQQAIAEYDSEIRASSLTFCYNFSKEVFVYADGRKMSRVISNLLNNVFKYALSNTRVFITTSIKKDKAILEIKNISSYAMNFDSEEITGRFVRGDSSRSTEGNGLGLAIAKTYTELCGGVFDVVTDGDLFKAIIEFNVVD